MGSLISYLTASGLSPEELEFQKLIGSEPIRIWLIGPTHSGKQTLMRCLSMPPLTHNTSLCSLSFETCNVQINSRTCTLKDSSSTISNLLNSYNTDGIIFLFQNNREDWSDTNLCKLVNDTLSNHANKLDNIPVLFLANHKTNWITSSIREEKQSHHQASIREIVKYNQNRCRSMKSLMQLFKHQMKFPMRYWFVHPVSVYTGEGVYQSLEWLCQAIMTNRIKAQERKGQVMDSQDTNINKKEQ